MNGATATDALMAALRREFGGRSLLTGSGATLRYRRGFRSAEGTAAAVVRPCSLLQLWRALQICAAFDAVVIMQAANTGLTGGSNPDDTDYGRDVVIISTLEIKGLHVLGDGEQTICLPGTTLVELEDALRPFAREPHSVIGSSCIGALVVGGICNNSGGALVRRGPAYSQLALFAWRDDRGALHLVNNLGIDLGTSPEEIFSRLERGTFSAADVDDPVGRRASAKDYESVVRAIDASSPARFNADPRNHFEASGSAGRVVVFAVRLDSFPRDAETRLFYIGTNNPLELTTLRRHMLAHFPALPVSAEYLHRDCFEIAERYGKDVFLVIRWLGTRFMPVMARLKRAFDAFGGGQSMRRGARSDRLLQQLSNFLPAHLPHRLRDYRDRYEHHLLLKVAGSNIARTADYLGERFPSSSGDFFECDAAEDRDAHLHRFAAAGAAIRFREVHRDSVGEIVALDIALPRNTLQWRETLPAWLAGMTERRLYYGHFFCHVFHQDYILKADADAETFKAGLLEILDRRGAEYPAEHNVGHVYAAKPALASFYRALDPTNSFNPGIGKTTKARNWAT